MRKAVTTTKASENAAFNKQSMISELIKSKHGDLMDYVPITSAAAQKEAEFLAHLISWNLIKGEIRDSKIALPVINLRFLKKEDSEFAENAIASLLTLDPRNLVKSYKFSKELTKTGKNITGGHRRLLEEGLRMYIAAREENIKWWNKTAVQHRESFKELYAISHYKPSDWAQKILFRTEYDVKLGKFVKSEFPKNSVFQKIADLKKMSPAEAAGTVLNYDIPFQIALGALGVKKEEFEKNPEFIMALMNGMSGQQLINSTKFLTSIGVFNSKMLKSVYETAFKKATKDKKVSTLKANKAIKTLEENPDFDPEVIEKLSKLSETKLAQKTIEGDWVILGDKSGSMSTAVKLAKEIASYISKSVAGKVYLIFFDHQPRVFDVTGKTLSEIETESKHVSASGCTSCGCGLQYLLDRGIIVNGIAMISDGGDNTAPYFHQVYPKYCLKMGIEPAVYFYRLQGESDSLSGYCRSENIPFELFDMDKTDYYALPNLVAAMKTSRYSLMDEIMTIPLLTFEKIFEKKGK
jgi:hypothetical protein